MAKQSGLGSALLVGGTDLSGDIGALDTISGGPAVLDVTSISKSAPERIGGLRSGDLQFTSWFNPAVGAEHDVLSALPTSNVVATALIGPSPFAVGGPAVSLTGKQINYDGTRGADGSLSFKVEIQSDGFGLEWGTLLTAGLRADTTATTGSAVDLGGSGTTFGAQAYLQLTAFTGTSVDVKIRHATTSGGTYSDLIDFGSQSAIGAFRATASGTVNEFVKVVTSGTFTVATFAVVLTLNQTSVSF